MCDFETGKIDFVLFGCAHYTLGQIRTVALLQAGKTLATDVELWILSSPQTRTMAEKMGYLKIISMAGGHIIGGSCSDMPVWDRRFAGKIGLTDSLKAKFYNSVKDMTFRVMPMEQCIEAAVRGSC
jgi:predicted aconitase